MQTTPSLALRSASGFLLFVLAICSSVVRATNAPPTCEVLQADLLTLSSKGGGTYQFVPGHVVECTQRSQLYKGSVSKHGLLIPEDVVLDLNSGRVDLRLTEQSYGVRLAWRATIMNGEVRVVESIGAGSQSIWHSAVSVGAANGDGGTADVPSYFSEIGNWNMINLRINQPFAHSGIQVMSEAHHGVIDGVRIASSTQATIGIGLDWGDVGNFHSNEKMLTAMRTLWEHGYVYTTHPHDITIQNIAVENLTRNANDDSAAIRTSATHNITIRNVMVAEAGSGIVLRAGDVGYEFARTADRQHAHQGLVVENFAIYNAHRKGVFLDGYADNFDRASRLYGCEQLQNPAPSRLQSPQVRSGYIRGHFGAEAGVYMKYVTAALIEGIDSQEFNH